MRMDSEQRRNEFAAVGRLMVGEILSAEEVGAMSSYLSLADSTSLRRSHEALRQRVQELETALEEASRD